MSDFKGLVGKKIEKLFLVVWAPWGEESACDIDMAFGFVFENQPSKLCIVSVDKDELWTPHIFFESLPENRYSWEDFKNRTEMWMKAEENNLIVDREYYDVTTSDLFKEINGKKIEQLELLKLEGNSQPFGIKILFKEDYIISVPNSDGNTVETKLFNKNNSIANFEYLGKVIYLKV